MAMVLRFKPNSPGAWSLNDYLTKEGIDQYVTFNHVASERLVESAGKDDALTTLITFNQPLAQAEFIAFIEQYQLTVESYIIWIENNDSTTTTIQGAPSEDDVRTAVLSVNLQISRPPLAWQIRDLDL